MRFTPLTCFLFLLCISPRCKAYGQQAMHPVDQWRSALSIKKDIKSTSFRSVFNELYALDSVNYCIALSLLNDLVPRENIHFSIRLRILESQLQLSNKSCPGAFVALADLQDALQTAYEIDDDWLKFELHNILSVHYTNLSNFGSAAMHAMSAIDLAEALGPDNLSVGAGGWYGLGYILYHSREYEASIKASAMALNVSSSAQDAPVDTLHIAYRMNALNSIGLCYEKLGKPDSAFWAFDQAMSIAEKLNNSFWKGIITGNKGDVYYQIGQYDSAKVFLTFDYQQSVAFQQNDNAANSLQWLARIELKRNLPQSALRMLRECMKLLQGVSKPEILTNTLYAFTQTFSALGEADSMNVYMHRYLTLHDSIEKAATESRLDIVRMRMDNQSNVYKVMSLGKEKRRITMIRNFIIVFICLLAITGFMILTRQKLNLKLKRMEALDEKRKAEQDAAQAREQLDVYTRHLREKTNLVETLRDQLMIREMTEDQMQQISALAQHTILTEEDWEEFKGMFEKVYPGFFHSLKHQSPDITLAEQRMAALCKLQLPTKEAANLLGISPNSVNKTRQRLRNRLGLDPEANLEQYFGV
ncbi:MAG: tetratricopeptide repeat protein [Saprospiraceae bacterium]|nr:tetratricopeptide repeat protein [Saprospiraceae bacterium]